MTLDTPPAPTKTPSASSLDALVSTYGVQPAFGVDRRGAAADRRSLFAAAGFDWPLGDDPESVHSRRTDYPYSVDVGGGRLVAALDRNGAIRRTVVADGEVDVRGRAIPGVYTHKTVRYWEGDLGWDLVLDGQVQRLAPAQSFLGGVLPMFGQRIDDVRIDWLAGAPHRAEAGAHVDFLVVLTNEGEGPVVARVEPRVHLSEGSRDQVVVSVMPPTVEGGACSIPSGGHAEFEVRVAFGSDGTEPAVDHGEVRSALDAEVSDRHKGLGTLTVPDDPWASGQLVRLVELARQSGLNLADGRSIGSFWGSNANPIPDVWFRDFAYTTLALVEFASDQAVANLGYLCRYALPDEAWEREAEVHPAATGLEHSLGNACLPAVVAERLVEVHGTDIVAPVAGPLRDYLTALLDGLTEAHAGPGSLYSTLYISDGPSRGDFHTGSNILAWAALQAGAGSLSGFVDEARRERAATLAPLVRSAIETRCVGDLGSHGSGFVEGLYLDGRNVAVHDGEESDLTLASYYGFTGRDDRRIINHAQWAWSSENPYYAPVSGGIDFWDWDDSNGITYPGYAHQLAAASTPQDLAAAQDAVRRTTDADGSMWWWPFAHAETDPARAKRGLGKCGWAAGVVVARMMHDVFGIRRSWRTRTVTVAPYLPWPGFDWTGLPFGDGTLDVRVSSTPDKVVIRVANNTDDELGVQLEAPVPGRRMIDDIRFGTLNARYQSHVVQSYDGSAVRMSGPLEAGGSTELVVTLKAL